MVASLRGHATTDRGAHVVTHAQPAAKPRASVRGSVGVSVGDDEVDRVESRAPTGTRSQHCGPAARRAARARPSIAGPYAALFT